MVKLYLTFFSLTTGLWSFRCPSARISPTNHSTKQTTRANIILWLYTLCTITSISQNTGNLLFSIIYYLHVLNACWSCEPVTRKPFRSLSSIHAFPRPWWPGKSDHSWSRFSPCSQRRSPPPAPAKALPWNRPVIPTVSMDGTQLLMAKNGRFDASSPAGPCAHPIRFAREISLFQ